VRTVAASEDVLQPRGRSEEHQPEGFVVVVDDGLATGMTDLAAVLNQAAGSIRR